MLENSERTQRVSGIHHMFEVTQFHSWLLTKNLSFFFFSSSVSGPVEADPEYRLIVAANNLTVEIDNELSELLLFLFKYLKCKAKMIFELCSVFWCFSALS